MSTDFAYLMEEVALLLLGKPNTTLSTKSELRYGNKGSLSIDLRKGTFYDWEYKEGGGVLDLIKRQTNCIDPIAWLHHGKLLSTPEVVPFKPRQQIEKRDTTPFARRIWHQCQPAVGTLVETYLRSRAITIPPPLSLKFHPALEYRRSATFWPCMVAVVSNAKGFLGIHRTYLARDGNGKAPVEEPKLALGKVHGGAVRLGPVGTKLYITEGIEDALSIMQVMDDGVPAWATLGTSGMRNLILPPEVQEIIICADNGSGGEQAARAAADRWLLEDRIVRIARPDAGKDFNDMLREWEEVNEHQG
jgi:Toprim domain